MLPGTIAVYLPDAITRGGIFSPPAVVSGLSRTLRAAAFLPVALGVLLYLRCAWDFAVKGLGTPAPIDPPKTLIARGPYRWTRNPMYVAVTSVIVGECVLTGSASLWWYALAVFVGFNLFVLLYEEPTLREKFGDQYGEYCARVPRWIMKLRIVALAVVVGGALTVGAQTPEFEAASVKPNNPNRVGAPGIAFSPGGHFTWTNMTLRQLINAAYADHQFVDVVGGPKWVYSDRFDIAATSPSALSSIGPDGAPERLLAMLRQVQMARGTLQRQPSLAPPCSVGTRPGHLTGRALTLSRLADALSQFAGRPVVDRTGVTAVFDVDLQWTPDVRVADLADPAATAPPADGPSIFTALQEQLGLRLQPTRGPVRILVIDGAELPSRKSSSRRGGRTSA